MTGQKGSILIFTLWVLTILAILSVILFSSASTDVRLAKHESNNIKAAYLAKAGIMKMFAELKIATDTNATLKEEPRELTIRGDIVRYGAYDEMARLNLNSVALEKDYLVRLGVEEGVAANIADYKIKKGAKGFEFIEELLLVEAMSNQVYLQIKDFVTVYRGIDPKVNINTVGEEVLKAIVGDDGYSVVEEILNYREGPDGEEGTEDDGIFNNDTMNAALSSNPGLLTLFTVRSNVFRIWAQSFLSGNEEVDKTIEAVIDKSGKIYYWKEL
jgi:type II secretory pathway component PulK